MNNFRTLLLTSVAGLFASALATVALAQTPADRGIVPTGKLRVGMNASNATLVTRAADGSVSGLSVDLGKFIAAKLRVPFEPVVYTNPAGYTASFGKGEWDILVTGRNPLAAKSVDFVADVILIDYMYIAAPGRDFGGPNEVDRAGVRIGVPRNASADAILSQKLKVAELVRVAGDLDEVAELLRAGKMDLYASGTENVRAIAKLLPGAKIIGAFDTVAFAVSTAKGWSAAAQDRLRQLVTEAKAAGVVRDAIVKSGLKGVRAATD